MGRPGSRGTGKSSQPNQRRNDCGVGVSLGGVEGLAGHQDRSSTEAVDGAGCRSATNSCNDLVVVSVGRRDRLAGTDLGHQIARLSQPLQGAAK